MIPDADPSKADPKLARLFDLLQRDMMALGDPIRAVEYYRPPGRQAEIAATGVQAALPGKSKHEHVEAGRPDAMAVDFCFAAPDPYSEAHLWGVVRQLWVERYGGRAISKWDPAAQRFAGDRCHLELI